MKGINWVWMAVIGFACIAIVTISFFGVKAYLDFGTALEVTATPFGETTQGSAIEFKDVQLTMGEPVIVPGVCPDGAGSEPFELTIVTDAFDGFKRSGLHVKVGDETYFYLVGQPVLINCPDGLRMGGRIHASGGRFLYRSYIPSIPSPFEQLEEGIEKQFTTDFGSGLAAYGITLGQQLPGNPDGFMYKLNTGLAGIGEGPLANMTLLQSGAINYGYFLVYRLADGGNYQVYYAPADRLMSLP